MKCVGIIGRNGPEKTTVKLLSFFCEGKQAGAGTTAIEGEFETHIRNNEDFIPNFGERYRNGEFSTASVESAVNQVISKRMEKKQQMQWTPRGAHLLLKTRTKVLNNELEALFRRGYPRFRSAA